MLNKSKGNMYLWATHTWNAIKGKCPHGCIYCYMNIFPQRELRLDEKERKIDLGSGNVIFVGSSTDMWAREVPHEWILKVLERCCEYPDNRYLFQTKNPANFYPFYDYFPPKVLLGITVETDRNYADITKAPPPWERYTALGFTDAKFPRMVSIEPIMDFDLEDVVAWIEELKPEFVSIGADSKNHHLPEPSSEKVQELIKELSKLTVVKVKPNLNRILNFHRQEYPDMEERI